MSRPAGPVLEALPDRRPENSLEPRPRDDGEEQNAFEHRIRAGRTNIPSTMDHNGMAHRRARDQCHTNQARQGESVMTPIGKGLLIACALALSGTGVAAQQDFPNRPIRIIVPYAAGGPSDNGTRLIQDSLSRELGQPVVIENRGGGGGLNATEAYLKSDSHDGYTLLVGAIGPFGVMPSLRNGVLRRPERLRADHHRVALRAGARRQQRARLQDRQGLRRLRQGQSEQAHARLRRRRRGVASGDGAAQARGQDRYHPRAVPQQQRGPAAGDGRADQRRCSATVRRWRPGARRQDHAARRRRSGARAGAAGCADDGRGRLPRASRRRAGSASWSRPRRPSRSSSVCSRPR